MAIRRDPVRYAPEAHLGPVHLDAQALQDLDALMRQVAESSEYESRRNESPEVKINREYSADSIHDVLTIERPVHRLSLWLANLSIDMDLRSTSIRGNSLKDTAHWVRDAEAILSPRVVPTDHSRFVTKRLMLTVFGGAALSFFFIWGLEPLFGWKPPVLLGPLAQIVVYGIGFLIPVKGPTPRSGLLEEPPTDPPFLRKYNTELTLLMLALAIVVPAIIALTD